MPGFRTGISATCRPGGAHEWVPGSGSPAARGSAWTHKQRPKANGHEIGGGGRGGRRCPWWEDPREERGACRAALSTVTSPAVLPQAKAGQVRSPSVIYQSFGFQEAGRSGPSAAPTAAPGPAAGHLGRAQGACKVSSSAEFGSSAGDCDQTSPSPSPSPTPQGKLHNHSRASRCAQRCPWCC